MGDAPAREQRFQGIGKLENRLARPEIRDPDAVPVRRRVDAGAERLGEGLLGGEALGEVAGGQAVPLEAPELRLAEDALGEALAEALERVKTLRGLLPICSWCKKIREDNGYWTQVESYFRRYSAAEFTHCICPACYTKMRDQDASQSA